MQQNILTFPSSLCFKGGRNYLHGTDIVWSLMCSLDSLAQVKLDIKFHGISHHQLRWIEVDEVELDEAAKVTGVLELKDKKVRFKFLESDMPVTCKNYYDESAIVASCDVNLQNRAIILTRSVNANVIEKIVAMQKSLLQSLFPDIVGKWYFTRLEVSDLGALSLASGQLELKFIKNFNFRLTKSDIFFGQKHLASIYFSLVKD